jgi:hypothetical protein
VERDGLWVVAVAGRGFGWSTHVAECVKRQ